MRGVRPPRSFEVFLGALLPAMYRGVVLDDLREEWERRVERAGRREADGWYRREVVRSVAPAVRLRFGARRVTVAGVRRGARQWEVSRIVMELHHAMRRLRRAPAFTTAATLTLAVGIGANVAMFSLIDGVLLRPLPFPHAARLVALSHAAPGLGLPQTNVSDGTFLHYREGNAVFEDMAIWQTASVNLTAASDPERVDLVLATPSFFDVLGVRPAVGSGFGADASGGTAVILSHGLWERRYGSDPGIVGGTIEVNGVARAVLGVMPRDFRFPHPRIDLWMDLGVRLEESRLGGFFYQSAARLRQGVTIEEARADLARLVPSLEGRFPDATRETLQRAGLVPRITPLKAAVVGNVGSTLWPLFGSVVLVLLIACVNVANLHLVRAAAREREVVVRAALGAGRGDLARHFLSESVALSVVGGAAGIALGWVAVRMVIGSGLVTLPRLEEVTISGRVAVFAAVLAVSSGLLLGLMPGLHAARASIGEGLRSAGRALTTSRERRRAQRMLVVLQIALALTLLVGSALMVQAFWRLHTADPGFDAREILTFETILPYTGYETYEKSASFQLTLLDRIRGLPGVQSAGAVGGLPMTTSEFPSFANAVEVLGRVLPVTERTVRFKGVTEGYFETMRTRILAGQPPARDAVDGSPVLISASLARRLFPDANAIGQRIRRVRPTSAANDEQWNTVVGVVVDVYDDGVAEPPPEIVYLPVLDAPVDPDRSPGFLAFALRSDVPTMSLVASIRGIVRELDPALPIASVRTMQSIVQEANARTTFTTLLLLMAALAALFLGVIGIHGVLSHAVGTRRRELGLRVALGAQASAVTRMVLGEGLVLAGAGIAIGGLAAATLTRYLRGQLYGVSPTDPLTFAATATLLLAVACVACALPARRAARIQPSEALADS